MRSSSGVTFLSFSANSQNTTVCSMKTRLGITDNPIQYSSSTKQSDLATLINLERRHYVQRALQDWIVRRELFRHSAAALLRCFGCFHLGIGSGQQRRFVHMRAACFVKKRSHSFLAV